MIYKKFNQFELLIAITTALFIFLFYLLFNLNYLTTWIDEMGDCKTYEYYVKLGIPQFLFNPHHIAFDWIGQQFCNLMKNQGYKGQSMIILQLRNLIISSIGLGILFFLFYKISKKYLLSFLLIGLIGFSCSFWNYSQINDTPIIHSVLVAILFFATIYFPQAKNKYLYSIFLGLFHAVNIFFHQLDFAFITVISFIILFANYFFLDEEKGIKYNPINLIHESNIKIQSTSSIKINNIRYFLIYLTTLSLIIIAVYYFVGVVLIGLTLNPVKAETLNKFKDGTYFFNWLVLYTKIDYWGKGYEGNTLLKSIIGISTYFLQPLTYNGHPVYFDFKNFFAPFAILPNLLFTFMIFVISFTLFFIVPLYKKYKYVFIANLIFIVVYTILACWWQPDYREFWVAPMFSFWILALLVFNYILDKLAIIKPIPQFMLYSFLTLIGILLFYFNFIGFLYSYASKDFRKFEIVNTNALKTIPLKSEKLKGFDIP